MDMQKQSERFTFIRETSGLSKLEFAHSLGIHPSLASLIESGSREASKEVLLRLAEIYKVNLNWYLTGNGETLIPDTVESTSVFVPHVLQEAAAGRGVSIEDYAETRSIAIPKSLVSGYNPAKLRAVSVRGDSMIEKGIFDKDIVVFNAQDVAGESISVVSMAGQLLVKHVSFDSLKKRLTLTSANAMYAPRVIEGTDLADVKIEGRVVACLHMM